MHRFFAPAELHDPSVGLGIHAVLRISLNNNDNPVRQADQTFPRPADGGLSHTKLIRTVRFRYVRHSAADYQKVRPVQQRLRILPKRVSRRPFSIDIHDRLRACSGGHAVYAKT